MALAIRLQQLVQARVIANYAALAQLGHVSRARVTQILNLLLLAPDIQEALLFLPRTERGRDPLHLRQLQRLALVADWKEQRKLWQALLAKKGLGPARWRVRERAAGERPTCQLHCSQFELHSGSWLVSPEDWLGPCGETVRLTDLMRTVRGWLFPE